MSSTLKNILTVLFCIVLLFFVAPGQAKAIEVALTIDGLPGGEQLPPHVTYQDVTKEILMALQKHHLKDVYGFVVGMYVNNHNRELLQNWVAEQQRLANHTFSHADLSTVSAQQYMEDIKKNDFLLHDYVKNENHKYFRYPYLSIGNTEEKRNAIRVFLSKNRYTVAMVTIDFDDWKLLNSYIKSRKLNNQASLENFEKNYIKLSLRALEKARATSHQLFHRDIKYILLIHYTAVNAFMLDQLLTAYEKSGVKFITLPDALSDTAYVNIVPYMKAYYG